MASENPEVPSEENANPEESEPVIKWPDEKEQYEEITEYIKQVDEILDFIKPFPRELPVEPNALPKNPETTPRPGLDHLGNLIKLVEQLKDLKEKNSKLQERTQYLKDLKKLHERKKRLKYEAELELQRGSPTKFWPDEGKTEIPTEGSFKKGRSSLAFRKNSRGRSKSVNIEEEREGRFIRERFPSQEQEPRRKSSSLLQKINVSGNKAKVSKWTKVKEAFRWEKASEPRSSKSKKDDIHRYLQVPHDKASESPSDLSGQISASSSVGAPSTSCLAAVSSGEHSSEGHSTSSGYALDLLPPPPPPPPPLQVDDDFLSLPLLQDLSSSSSSEKLDELLTYSELLAKGNCRSGSTADSIDVSFHHLDLHPDDEIETRRSKSLDGDMILGPSSNLVQHLSKDSLSSSKLPKTHKTPWGKVKDIIQTRKDSLKKKPKKRGEEFRRGMETFSVSTDHDIEMPEDLSSPEEKPKDSVFSTKPKIEVTSEPTLEEKEPTPPPKPESVAARRLTPVLTITLPSTEELRNFEEKSQKPPTPVSEKKNRMGQQQQHQHLCQAEYFEDIPKYEKGKPNAYHRRFSRWTKVKRAFLTSTSPTRSPDYLPGLNSVPSSPNRHSSFFSDVESDELSSGEWAEDKTHSSDKTVPELESPTTQVEIQKSYLELQQKLVREFDQKVREWERSKSTDSTTRHEENYQKSKIEEWDRMPRSSRQRESMAIPLPTMDDLSPEFKKKLDEWKKIKKSQTTPAVPNVLAKDENPGQHFKMRIGEWQKWRPRSSHKPSSYKQDNLPDEFCRKLEEWQKIKGSDRRSRSQSDRGKDENGNRTPSPRLSRKNSKGAIKKITSSGKSSGTESLSGSLKEKDGRGGSRKIHKEKDLQWLEKELHKIEREKLRLEREREKYLEREARLEQMKKTMGTASPTQEVLIKTPTGFFRFEGISQKFTKKLYEWEKARGIAPEASTFALLEECAKKNTEDVRANGTSLPRSKSVGSVIELTSTSVVPDIPHHPSSLSLNDVDELEALEETGRMESRASSEPTLAVVVHDEDEPQAIIVDVEDVVEETAALMADEPLVKGEVPVYSYAPEEVTQLIDSSGSDCEVDIQVRKVQTKQIDELESSSSRLIDHNIDLLDELEVKEAICRKLENDLENIEAKINDDKKSGKDEEEKEKEQDQLKRDGEDLQHSFAEHSKQQANLAHNLVDNMKLLDVMTSSSNQQEAVSRVQELSSQLLCLAEKLESALSERNEDVKNLRSNLYNRRERSLVNRLQTGQIWYSADGAALPADRISLLDASATSQELSQLPSLITSKVLELKCGLNILRSATDFAPKEQATESYHADPENTASFVVQVSKDGKRNSVIDVTDATETAETNSRRSSVAKRPLKISQNSPPNAEDLSPVNVTISPPSFHTEAKVQKLEKSKVQIIYGEAAAKEFEKNSKDQVKNSPEVIKRKIKEKISLMQRMTTEGRPRIYKPLEFNYNKHVDDDITDDESMDVKDEEESEEKVIVVKKNGKGSKPRKILKTRRITDTTIAYNKQGVDENRTSSEKDDSDEVFIRDEYKQANPTYIHFQRRSSNDSGARSSTDVDIEQIFPQPDTESGSDISSSPQVNVFVHTTRKIISPVRRDSRGATSSVLSYVIDDIEKENNTKQEEEKNLPKTSAEPPWKQKLSRAQSASPGVGRKLLPKKPEQDLSERKSSSESGASMECAEKKDIGIPPLPNSPSTTRKSSCKEAAPSIRMMIAKYNQKIEQEAASETGSGTASPIAWRSPISERRVQVQLDGTNLLKHGGKFNRIEVQKSASAGFIRSPESISRNTSSESIKGILKSSSVGAMKPLMAPVETPAEETPQSASALRALRIKKAKEEFLLRGPSGQGWTSEVTTPVTPLSEVGWDTIKADDEKSRNRLSHISVGSESSYDEISVSESNNLIKSASAGMINLEQRELLRRSSGGTQDDESTSSQIISKNVPIAGKSSSKFGISSIKSKFRKARMRKAKDKEVGKMNTVSALCRQSLYLDVSNGSQRTQSIPCTSKSCPSSPVLERSKSKSEDSKSWIRNPARKIFKSKDSKDVK